MLFLPWLPEPLPGSSSALLCQGASRIGAVAGGDWFVLAGCGNGFASPVLATIPFHPCQLQRFLVLQLSREKLIPLQTVVGRREVLRALEDGVEVSPSSWMQPCSPWAWHCCCGSVFLGVYGTMCTQRTLGFEHSALCPGQIDLRKCPKMSSVGLMARQPICQN